MNLGGEREGGEETADTECGRGGPGGVERGRLKEGRGERSKRG